MRPEQSIARNGHIDFPSQQKTTAAFGRFQENKRITSDYIERERSWGNEGPKTEQRQRIREFFLSYHMPDEQIRLISLPGIHWQFERELLEKHKNCKFTAFEWTWGVIELGAPYMPGKSKCFSEFKLTNGRIDLLHSEGVGNWFWVHASTFLTLERKERGGHASKAAFAKKYKSHTCIWLDFTSQLCNETRSSIMAMQSSVDMTRLVVPVAITVMAARDNHSTDAERTDEICSLLSHRRWRVFELTDSWTYTHHDIPMLTVMGVLKPKELAGISMSLT